VIKRIFSRSGSSGALQDFSSIAVDIHSHLIPGIDDGAETIEDSLAIIKRMQELGFKKLVTTPHIQQEHFKNTPEIILEGLGILRDAILHENVPIEVQASAEYMIDDGFEEKSSGGRLLTFGDNYVLVELSYFNPHPNLKTIIFNLQIDGYKVILAHPERYTYWFSEIEKFEELKDRGVFFQLNLVSLSGYYPGPIRKFAEKMIDLGMFEFVGSDMHNMNYMAALEKSLNERSLVKLMESGRLRNSEL
jgi:tyrosine-protein phosphatase YwqE